MNIFNDFHSRAGAPEAGPFYTLQDHENKIMSKLEVILCARRQLPIQTCKATDPSETGAITSSVGASSCCTSEVGTEAAECYAAVEGDNDNSREHFRGDCQAKLVDHRELMPETMDAMGPTEANMAGQRLLPSLDPFDWPGPRQIHAAQQDIPGPAQRTLRSIDTAEPDIALWTET